MDPDPVPASPPGIAYLVALCAMTEHGIVRWAVNIENGGQRGIRTSRRQDFLCHGLSRSGGQFARGGFERDKGLPHGMATTHHDIINANLLTFLKS